MFLFGFVINASAVPEGVYFKQGPNIIFSDSQWIITTEVTFTNVIKNIHSFKTYLKDRIWNKTRIQGTHYLEHQVLHENPTEPQTLLLKYAQKFTDDSLRTLETISNRLNLVINSVDISDRITPIQESNVKARGLLNLGGDILKWLLGTANNKDLELLNNKLITNPQENLDIIHALKDQATIVSENLHQTSINKTDRNKLERC